MRKVFVTAANLHTILPGVNRWFDTTEGFTALGLFIASGIATGTVAVFRRLFRKTEGVFYEVLYDEVINSEGSLRSRDPQNLDLWTVVSEGREATVNGRVSVGGREERARNMVLIHGRPVVNGSQAIIEIRNASKNSITSDAFGGQLHTYTVVFPGRTVINYKVRDGERSPGYNATVKTARGGADGAQRVKIEGNSLTLPGMDLDPGESFKLQVLLDDEDGRQADEDKYPQPRIDHSVIRPTPPPDPARPYILSGIAFVTALVLVAAGLLGASIVSSGNKVQASCFSGPLTIEGSTAFAPIANQAAALFTQVCEQAGYDPEISIAAVGSVAGLQDVESVSSPAIGMYDGSPDPGKLYSGTENYGFPDRFNVTPLGVIIFAVVRNDLPQSDSPKEMSNQQVEEAYSHPSTPVQGKYVVPTGRTSDSGTRQTFDNFFLSGKSGAQPDIGAPNCALPPTNPTPSGSGGQAASQQAGEICLWGSTTDLLTYVNNTPNTIGYAEADALPFFPDVSAITVGNAAPTRQDTLSGKYRFDTVEHLYTDGAPTADEQDFLTFIASGPVTAQLPGNAFIACSDLGGNQIADACGQ